MLGWISAKNHGGRSQEVKALDCGSSIRGFKSHRPPLLHVVFYLSVAPDTLNDATVASLLGAESTRARQVAALARMYG